MAFLVRLCYRSVAHSIQRILCIFNAAIDLYRNMKPITHCEILIFVVEDM